jgi:hypothetical protein
MTGHHSLHCEASSQSEFIIIEVITKKAGGEFSVFTHLFDIYQSILRSFAVRPNFSHWTVTGLKKQPPGGFPFPY